MKQCGRRVVGGVMSTRTLAERGGRRPDRPAHGLAVSGPEIFVQASISETSDFGAVPGREPTVRLTSWKSATTTRNGTAAARNFLRLELSSPE